jgi:Escherichia/Staphylococcus phage prohead protease
MDYIYAPFLEIKVAGNGDKTFAGLGSAFNSLDSRGDTIAHGAFKQSILDAKSGAAPWPAMMLNHHGNPIGAWLDMSESQKGLHLKGQLADTEMGNTIYELLKMKPRAAMDGLSIGYRVRDAENHKNKSGPNGASRTLKAIDIIECSICTFPADKLARITAVKFDMGEEPAVDQAALMKAWATAEFERMRRVMNSVPR